MKYVVTNNAELEAIINSGELTEKDTLIVEQGVYKDDDLPKPNQIIKFEKLTFARTRVRLVDATL